ncbi:MULTISPECIES: UbiA family prenyltransferase [Microbulbifer]|uniref:UbiA family prenyltransferase n=1 Tax=Microbulbifer TaxID=48073 RepID=UPI001E5DE590|nr:UbiA family prenyltransferase [Microbulbifer sp. YPW16]UHQ54056.1 UbiA family prenyltransferase [Microbulbifer sp. YPW16]
MSHHESPLIVDLDGSLIRTDLLYESFVRTLFTRPWALAFLPLWLFRGIAYLKYRLAQAIDIDVSALPYNSSLLEFLREQKAQGRSLVLCTGANEGLAREVMDHLGIFDEIYATGITHNLTGERKAQFLRERYGERGFSYVGNENRDLRVWRFARSAVVVGSSRALAENAAQVCQLENSFPTAAPTLSIYLRQVRIHQWVKNLLLFVPLVTSHQFLDAEAVTAALLAFVCFGLCASATYIINDIADLDSDRAHQKKRWRPLASGMLSIRAGLLLCCLLLLASGVLVTFLPPWFGAVLFLYLVTTLGYSFLLKRLQTVDTVVLAGLYTTRILAGAAAIGVYPSYWLLAFSMFVFLCLALVKRISEIYRKQGADETSLQIRGRGYFTSDLPVLTSLASAAGMVSILVFAMYVNSAEVMGMYRSPMILWLACPLFAYWIIRMLVMASRGEIDEDPIAFAIKDKRSWITGLVLGLVLAAASTMTIQG